MPIPLGTEQHAERQKKGGLLNAASQLKQFYWAFIIFAWMRVLKKYLRKCLNTRLSISRQWRIEYRRRKSYNRIMIFYSACAKKTFRSFICKWDFIWITVSSQRFCFGMKERATVLLILISNENTTNAFDN